MQRTLLMVLALGATLALAGCSGDGETGGDGARRVALIYKATTNPFFQAME
ncbi:MAG: sugar ABC transporter substrate-binding protein, partial [Planctomycetes bacterium]|nr:sugar ABC transporter substrate-binding protein [Planctomycetota bacterium]